MSVPVIQCRIYYLGPGGTGRRTNLQHLHNSLRDSRQVPRISGMRLAYEDRLGQLDDMRISLILSAEVRAELALRVPDAFDFTRWMRDPSVCDGVVFVADSSEEAPGPSAGLLAKVRERTASATPPLPLVVQLNKRDRCVGTSVDEVLRRMGGEGLPCFEASAPIGLGVYDTLKAIVRLVLLEKRRQLAAQD